MDAVATEVTFAVTDEQDDFREMVRSLMERRSSEKHVREAIDSDRGYEQELWQLLAELGLTGLIIDEEHGGLGFLGAELGIAMHEMGRALLTAPYFSTAVLAAAALRFSDDSASQLQYLPAIAAGDTIATLALAESGSGWSLTGIETTARCVGDQWTVTGTKRPVPDGCNADLLLVAARTDAGLSLFAVQADACRSSRLPMADETRRQAIVTFDAAPGQLVGTDGGAEKGLRRALDLAAVALAAEQVGGAERSLELAAEYTKDREQFGRRIGSFQAIKHKCADMLLEVETARACAAAAASVAHDAETLRLLAPIAAIRCASAYVKVTAEAIQILGGIGFTWEHPAHFYFKRARSTEQMLAAPSQDRAALWAEMLR